MTKQYTVQAPDGKTITLEGPDGASEDEVIRQAQALYVPTNNTPAPTAAAPPQPQVGPLQSNEAQAILGAQPADLLERLKGAGRVLARGGLGVVQYGQYLTGSKVTPTPLSLQSTDNPNAKIGETIGSMLPAIVSGGASAPVQAAVGALTGGLAEQAAGGTGTAGAIAGGIGGAIPFMIKSAGEALQKTSPIINRWLQVAPKEMEYGADPGARILKEGLVKATKQGTQQAISPALQDAGNQLNAKLLAATAQGTKIDASNIVQNALSSATKTIGKRSDMAFQTVLTQHFDDIIKEFPDIQDLTPLRAQQLKIAVGEAIKWHGAAYEGDINEALVDIYRGLNNEIKTNVKGVDALQSRWGDLYLANKALKASAVKDAAGVGTGSLNPLIKTGAKVAGAAAGAATAGGLIDAGFRRMTR